MWNTAYSLSEEYIRCHDGLWNNQDPSKEECIIGTAKNYYNINFLFEVKLLSKEDFSRRAHDIVAPKIIDVTANHPFFLYMQLKINTAIQYKLKIDLIRKILVMQVQGSKLFFSYLL
jgi:hypothetical protein